MQTKGLRPSGQHNPHDEGSVGNCDAFFESSDSCAPDDDAGGSAYFSGSSLSSSQFVFSCLESYGSLKTNAFVVAIVGCPENLVDAGMELGV